MRAIDEQNKLSDAGDAHKFTLVAQGKEQEMLLEVDSTELQGNVVEVIGRTEPGAALISTASKSPTFSPTDSFAISPSRCPVGSHPIVITGQNRRGGTAIKRVEVVIP